MLSFRSFQKGECHTESSVLYYFHCHGHFSLMFRLPVDSFSCHPNAYGSEGYTPLYIWYFILDTRKQSGVHVSAGDFLLTDALKCND